MIITGYCERSLTRWNATSRCEHLGLILLIISNKIFYAFWMFLALMWGIALGCGWAETGEIDRGGLACFLVSIALAEIYDIKDALDEVKR